MVGNKSKYGLALLAATLAIALVGCSSGDESSETANAAPSSTWDAGAPMHSAARQAGAPRAVIRQGSLSVDVADIEKAEEGLKTALSSAGGYLVHLESRELAGERPELQLTIRVPEKEFEGLMEKLEGLGHRTHKAITASDITEQVLDAEATLQQLQRSKSAKPEDVAAVRGERDRLIGKATMSTLEVYLREKPNAGVAAAENANWGSDTWNAAVTSAMGAFRAIGSLAIWMLVYSPIWGALGIALIWGYRRRKPRLA